MNVLKLTFEGLTASFRYPHFTWGRQPTYFMPPPSTIYGLICSAVGEWIDPETVQFAYHFQYDVKAEDLEHIHAVVERKGIFPFQGMKYPKNLEGNINPLVREFLYHPKLTLYVSNPDLLTHFMEPRYPMTLGRSQDLLVLNTAEYVALKKSTFVYFEHTLLSWEFRPFMKMGLSVMMPRFIDTAHHRKVDFERYVLLQQRLYTEKKGDILVDHCLVNIRGNQQEYWYDPDAPVFSQANRGVFFHSFVKEGTLTRSQS